MQCRSIILRVCAMYCDIGVGWVVLMRRRLGSTSTSLFVDFLATHVDTVKCRVGWIAFVFVNSIIVVGCLLNIRACHSTKKDLMYRIEFGQVFGSEAAALCLVRFAASALLCQSTAIATGYSKYRPRIFLRHIDTYLQT
jgi:hypothetical protein